MMLSKYIVHFVVTVCLLFFFSGSKVLNTKSSSKSPEIEVVKADSTKPDTATVIQKLITFQELDVSFFF